VKISERMTRNVKTLTADQNLKEALGLMQRHHIRHVPVVEGERVVGIVTDRDVRRATPSLLSGADQDQYERVLTGTKVSQVMTRNPYTVTPSMKVRDVVKILLDRKFESVPVVESDRLVGIMTVTDMLRVLVDLLED